MVRKYTSSGYEDASVLANSSGPNSYDNRVYDIVETVMKINAPSTAKYFCITKFEMTFEVINKTGGSDYYTANILHPALSDYPVVLYIDSYESIDNQGKQTIDYLERQLNAGDRNFELRFCREDITSSYEASDYSVSGDLECEYGEDLLCIGSTPVKDVYLGSQPIGEMYIGDKMVGDGYYQPNIK